MVKTQPGPELRSTRGDQSERRVTNQWAQAVGEGGDDAARAWAEEHQRRSARTQGNQHVDIGVGEDGDDAARASLCTQPESAVRAAAEKHTVTAASRGRR